MTKRNCFISIVAPAYNEQENVKVFYDRMKAVLEELTTQWEIICVNDGSKDNTLKELVSNLYTF